MSKKKDLIVQKIEIDDNTQEPRVVGEKCKNTEVKDQAVAENGSKEQFSTTLPADGEHKQIVMSQVFGLSPEEKSVSHRQKVFKITLTVLFITIVVGVLIFTFLKDFIFNNKPVANWNDLSKIFAENWYFIICAFVSLGIVFLAKGIKLSSICKPLTGKFHFGTCMETGIVGLYYNNVTPMAVGGQPFEIYHLSKHGVHGGAASSMPIATYILNQLSFVLLGFTALILYSTNALGVPKGMTEAGALPFTVVSVMAIVGLSLCAAIPLLVILFCMLPRACSKIVKFFINLGHKLHLVKNPQVAFYKTVKSIVANARCLKRFAKMPLPFIINFIFSLMEHFASCSIAYFTLRFFGFNWPAPGFQEWAQVVQICLILYGAISFIPTPGNSGAADLSFYVLFEKGFEISGAKVGGLAFPAMMVWRLLSFYSYIIIGFIFTKAKKRADLKRATKLSSFTDED